MPAPTACVGPSPLLKLKSASSSRSSLLPLLDLCLLVLQVKIPDPKAKLLVVYLGRIKGTEEEQDADWGIFDIDKKE